MNSPERKNGRNKVAAALSLCCSTVLFLAGCVTTEDMDQMKGDVFRLQRELAAQKKDTSEIKGSLSDISKDITSLKEYSLSAMKESQSSLVTQASDISKEVQSLKGRFDENKYFMDKTIKDMLSERELQQAKIAKLENELKEIKAGSEKKETPASQENRKETEPPETKEAKADDINAPKKLYDEAHIDFKEKKYADARRKFEKFTKDFPKHELLPNAYFWAGEADHADKRYEDAILSYESFLKKYPKHEKAKGAMFKQALSFIEMGDKKTGKVLLEKVMEKYPNSREAELAEKKIGEMLSKNNAGSASKTAKKKKK
ncbi:MAG TPA: tol-pal system protein YbgF [Nitrospiraceae bacterium]|nr:tol-pal system protein YbgF [Nitrospiraceae bacterium]